MFRITLHFYWLHNCVQNTVQNTVNMSQFRWQQYTLVMPGFFWKCPGPRWMNVFDMAEFSLPSALSPAWLSLLDRCQASHPVRHPIVFVLLSLQNVYRVRSNQVWKPEGSRKEDFANTHVLPEGVAFQLIHVKGCQPWIQMEKEGKSPYFLF